MTSCATFPTVSRRNVCKLWPFSTPFPPRTSVFRASTYRKLLNCQKFRKRLYPCLVLLLFKAATLSHFWPGSSAKGNIKDAPSDISRWREIVKREKDFQAEWRNMIFDAMFEYSTHKDMILELPQVWVVLEKSGISPSAESKSFDAFTRVQLFKVIVPFCP